MNRREILAETLARLEAERYAPRASWKASRAPRADPDEALLTTAHEHLADILDTQDDLTPAQQAANQKRLLDALSRDAVVIKFREREAS